MKKITFIVNPKAGVSKKQKLPKTIKKHLDKNKYTYNIEYTKKPNHATKLAKAAVNQGVDVVVAVGGDGSVNEVMSGLVGTNTVLGILPMGSGNGLAMHLGLGRQLKKAIQILNTGKVTKIDTCQVNDRPFINLAGLGIDGYVSYLKSKKGTSGFFTYVYLGLKSLFTAPYNQFEIAVENGSFEKKEGFLLEVANGPMFGYGFSIVPSASLNDEWMHILFIKKRPKLFYLPLLVRLYMQNIEKSKMVETYKVKDFSVRIPKPIKMHLDGEGFIQEKNMHFQILPKSLKILVPQNSKY